MYSAYFVFACLALIETQSKADLFQEDGVLIEKIGPTRTIEAMWTTLVVIDLAREVSMQKDAIGDE